MKFKINSQEFSRAFIPTLEISKNNCVKDSKYEGLATIVAGDKDVSILSYGGTECLLASISDSKYDSMKYECLVPGQSTINSYDLYMALTTIPAGIVTVENKNGEVVVSCNSDTFRSMGTEALDVELPTCGKKVEQSLVINREIFINGLKGVLFAPAEEEKQFQYMCVLMETENFSDKQILRFSAGTGSRFAVKEVECKNMSPDDKNVRFIFPKSSINSIFKIISSVTCDKIKITSTAADPENNVANYISIEFNSSVMRIFGLDSITKYPDLSTIINNKYPNRISTDMKDWQWAVGGIKMSKRAHLENIHNTDVVFEAENERFVVTPRTAHKIKTIVKIIDNSADACVAKGENIWFRCNSEYLQEMVSKGGKEGSVKINFESQSILDVIPEGEPKKMKPILISYPETVDGAKDIKERFYIFFTVSNK